MSKDTKEKKESSPIASYIYALLVACLGFAIGVVYMMTFPIQSYASLAEYAEAMEEREVVGAHPSDAYYIEGPTDRGRSWEVKRKQLVEGSASVVTFSAGELNAWLAARFRPASGGPSNDSAQGLTIMPGLPNIAVDEENRLHVNLPAQISGYGLDGEYMISVRGQYKAGTNQFSIDYMQVGAAPVPFPSLIGNTIVSVLMKGYSATEEYKAIMNFWSKVESVEAIDRSLQLSLL